MNEPRFVIRRAPAHGGGTHVVLDSLVCYRWIGPTLSHAAAVALAERLERECAAKETA